MITIILNLLPNKKRKPIMGLSCGLIGLLTLMAAVADGASVALDPARRAAENQLGHHVTLFGHWADDPDPQLHRVQLVNWHENTVAYQFDVQPSGYILVAVDDAFSPVLLYSTRASFDLRRVNDPRAVESWIVPELDHRLRIGRSVQGLAAVKPGKGTGNVSAMRIRRSWDHIRSSPADAAGIRSSAGFLEGGNRRAATRVGPLLESKWGQDAPFNALAPDKGCHSGRTLAGCVAVAWAQLLRYWRWPDRAEGSHAYEWSGQLLQVDFDAAPLYDWDNMPDGLGADSSQIQIDAVARLIYHLAVAAETDFACSVSSSEIFADDILDTYFKFSSDMKYHDRAKNAYTDEQWFALIKAELDADPPRPVVLSIWGTHGGHEVIADGYLSGDTDMVHINFGWNGNLDLYYNITDAFQTGTIGWSANTQIIITGIRPDYTRASASSDNGASGACFIKALCR